MVSPLRERVLWGTWVKALCRVKSDTKIENSDFENYSTQANGFYLCSVFFGLVVSITLVTVLLLQLHVHPPYLSSFPFPFTAPFLFFFNRRSSSNLCSPWIFFRTWSSFMVWVLEFEWYFCKGYFCCLKVAIYFVYKSLSIRYLCLIF